MLQIRRAHEIHEREGGWFNARWHFSFDSYRDPENNGIGPLRVFNDDRLIAGAVWPMHPHRDVEGLTYVVEGLFGHEDNIGGDFGPLPAGSVQRMTLGRGALHSELNASDTEPMRFIQIWILPFRANLAPHVEQKVLTTADRTNRLLRVFSGTGEGAVKVYGDVEGFVSRLETGEQVSHAFGAGRAGYLYAIDGEFIINGEKLTSGDAVNVFDEPVIELTAVEDSELILLDIPVDYDPVGVWAH